MGKRIGKPLSLLAGICAVALVWVLLSGSTPNGPRQPRTDALGQTAAEPSLGYRAAQADAAAEQDASASDESRARAMKLATRVAGLDRKALKPSIHAALEQAKSKDQVMRILAVRSLARTGSPNVEQALRYLWTRPGTTELDQVAIASQLLRFSKDPQIRNEAMAAMSSGLKSEERSVRLLAHREAAIVALEVQRRNAR